MRKPPKRRQPPSRGDAERTAEVSIHRDWDKRAVDMILAEWALSAWLGQRDITEVPSR